MQGARRSDLRAPPSECDASALAALATPLARASAAAVLAGVLRRLALRPLALLALLAAATELVLALACHVAGTSENFGQSPRPRAGTNTLYQIDQVFLTSYLKFKNKRGYNGMSEEF